MEQPQRALSEEECNEAKADGSIYVIKLNDEEIAVAVPKRAKRYMLVSSDGTYGISRFIMCKTNAYLGYGLIKIPPKAIVINVGANIGEVAMGLESRGALVLAVEPDPHVLPSLYKNVDDKNIQVEPTAVWESDGPRNFYLNTDDADSSLINVTDKPYKVLARSIDGLVEKHQIPQVYLLCGDAEGAEPEVLKGAKETLKHICYVSLRCSAERHGEPTADECRSILEAAGFEIIYEEKDRYRTLIGRNRRLGGNE